MCASRTGAAPSAADSAFWGADDEYSGAAAARAGNVNRVHASPNPAHKMGDNVILHIAGSRGCEYIVKLCMASSNLELRNRHEESGLEGESPSNWHRNINEVVVHE
jgi:hypothetical protein